MQEAHKHLQGGGRNHTNARPLVLDPSRAFLVYLHEQLCLSKHPCWLR